jgi:predicted homoserine dehydrogenase-like protein
MIKQGLEARHAARNPIRVGFVGAGRMGTGGICQIGAMRGMETTVIVDLNIDNAIRALELCRIKRDGIIVTNKLSEAEDAVAKGKRVVTQDSGIVTALEAVEVVLDATGNPELGAVLAFKSIMAKKHIVMLNVEADVAIGPILHEMAKNAGVVYTVSSGDEPGLIAEFFDRYTSLGFEMVAVGKTPSSLGQLDFHATPESVAEDAKKLGVNPHFLTTFRDATKTMIEMSCIANYTGLVPDVRGMHGPVAGIHEIPRLFRTKEDGGILNRKGVIDYAVPLKTPDGQIDFLRSVTPGVFLVVYTDNPQTREDLKYFDVAGGDGYYNFYLPYHLVTCEMPLSIASAALFNQPTIVPKYGLVSEVVGIAKQDLRTGRKIDGQGGSCVYSSCDVYAKAKADNLVPLALLTGATLKKDVKRDQAITWDMVDVREDTFLYKLRDMQNALIAK